MSNSKLVDYIRISPNRNSPRTHTIDRITPHCYVGQASVESMGNWLCSTNAQASCNYGIGYDGRVGMFVEEKDRSWCSSSGANDHRAITIECASASAHPYAINDKVYNKLIDLMVDICKRYNKKKLLWLKDRNKTLSYEPKSDEMIITVHRWFANKACPGDYIYERLDKIANTVTARLQGISDDEVTVDTVWYRVRKSWSDRNSQLGAYEVLENAKKNCPPGYSVFNMDGVAVYTVPIETIDSVIGVPTSKREFINAVSKIAMTLYKETNILPSVVIAQCCLETGYGIGTDALKLVQHNNLLGMKSELLNSTWKAYSVWNGKSIVKVTPEVINGKTIYKEDSFRVYTDYENCIRDYEMFLLHVTSGGQYKYRKIIAMTDPKDVITAISKGGYATDPSYITKVLKIISDNDLTKYDKEVGVENKEPQIEVHSKEESFDGYYRVQLGNYKKKTNAEKKAKSIREKGFDCTVKQNNDIYYIQIGAYKIKENAVNKLKEVKAAGFTKAVVIP